nr:MAG: polyprotein 2 [Picornavirales sp.]
MLENMSRTGIVENFKDTSSNVEVVSENFMSGIRLRNNVEPDTMYETFPEQGCVSSDFLMDYTRILNKPFRVGTVKWDTSAFRNTFLDIFKFPELVLSNPLASIPFDASTMYRCKASLILQVSGTPMHQGTLVAAALPVGYGTAINPGPLGLSAVNTLLAAPHVFLSANESTPATLEIPFYPNSKLTKCDVDLSTVSPTFALRDYADIVLYVLNPLSAPTSGTTTLTVTMHVVFKYLEFYAPHFDTRYQAEGLLDAVKQFGTKTIDKTFSTARDVTGDFFDTARSLVKTYTGMHNPNVPELVSKMQVTNRQLPNVVDKPTQFEKLDPFYDFDRITNQPIFDTHRDEMSLREILRKPQFLGKFTVFDSTSEGKLLWSRPITPLQEFTETEYTDATGVIQQTYYFTNLQQTLATMAKYWKGSMKLHIQSNMSNFHFCKLMVARDYSVRSLALVNPGVAPLYDQISNFPSETLEFSAGGQVQTIDLPFVSPLEQLPVAQSPKLNASEHGTYYIYLNQPLVTNGSVNSSIEFNVYLSCGDDFELYGYSTDPYRIYYPGQIGSTPALLNDKPLLQRQFAEQQDEFVAQGSANPVNVSSQSNINFVSKREDDTHEASDLRPITSIRDISRRLYKLARYKYSSTELRDSGGVFTYNIAALLGLQEQVNEIGVPSPDAYKSTAASTLRRIMGLYHGFQGGAKFKIIVQGTSGASAWFVPPTYGYRTDPTLDAIWAGNLPFPAASATTAHKNIVRSMYQNLKYTANTLDEEFSCQSVLQERPNYFATGIAGLIDPTQAGLAAESVSVLDVEVPNMSPYRFLGDATGHLHVLNGPVYDSPTINLGHIVLFIPQQITEGADITESGAYISFFGGLNDSARLGYQVYAPYVLQPAVVSSTNPLYQPISTSNQGNGVPVESVRPRVSCPGAYYTQN